MGEPSKHLPELEALVARVYQAKELIARLKQSNRALASRLEEAERRLGELPTAGPGPEPSRAAAAEDLIARLDRLRRERREIRERLAQVLEELEGLDL